MLQYKRDLNDATEDNISKKHHDFLQEKFILAIEELNLKNEGYSVTYFRELLNSKLTEFQVTNRKVKQTLIAHFGENICFTYPRDNNKSQMFFLAELRSTDIVESLRSSEMKDPIQVCAKKLKEECLNFDFNLDDTYCDIDDINKSSSFYQESRLDAWETFFNSLFTTRDNSENIQRCDGTLENNQ